MQKVRKFEFVVMHNLEVASNNKILNLSSCLSACAVKRLAGNIKMILKLHKKPWGKYSVQIVGNFFAGILLRKSCKFWLVLCYFLKI